MKIKEIIESPKLKELASFNEKLGNKNKKAEERIAALKVQLKALAREPQVMHLRKSNESLELLVDRLRTRIGQQRELGAQIAAAIVAAEPAKPIRWKRPPRPGKPVVAAMDWSDLHIGEKTSADETEEFGEYSWAIAQARFHHIVGDFLRWVETQRHGYRIDDCALFLKGDYISGDIHDELRATNEFPIPVQTAKAGTLLADGVIRIAPHFAKLRLIEVGADNHGRLQKKPQSKQKFQNSMSFLVQFILNQAIAKHKNVEIDESIGIKKTVTVGGWSFLVEHGDAIRGWMGIPWYGIERLQGREARKRMYTKRGFHYHSIAHWHVAGFHGITLFNGSLSGTSEYDHGQGRHSPPAQAAYLIHPEHGVFNHTPFHA